jgi:magnesium-transporting ATPase (P-type)
MRELEDGEAGYKIIKEMLKEFNSKSKNTVLIIDGKSLDSIFKNESCEALFFEEAIKAPCVCVCRCSPT